jgi:hypothetical protein
MSRTQSWRRWLLANAVIAAVVNLAALGATQQNARALGVRIEGWMIG